MEQRSIKRKPSELKEKAREFYDYLVESRPSFIPDSIRKDTSGKLIAHGMDVMFALEKYMMVMCYAEYVESTMRQKEDE